MNEVVIKPSLREQFLQGWAQCRVIFFSAPCGFGKSTAATALLSNHKTCVFSAEDPEFLREPVPKNVDAIVIDSLPALKDRKTSKRSAHGSAKIRSCTSSF